MSLDPTTRCPQRYARLSPVTPEEAASLECRDYHEHRPRYCLVTDSERHFEAEREWVAELWRIAALPSSARAAAIRELAIHDVDRDQIDRYAEQQRRTNRIRAR
ncbi:hypothetical protein [Nocardia terpenica]|uniref:Uncharacterized protein n=1 Tax=Nocardia terpenica TaxID=455432 RepID=A0A291RY87_9NOCA|nr:hypothetical protein [Nocardia terpenica]ATL72503.1 hypothetical protein CRH09_39715 [Nocardia terpenica]